MDRVISINPDNVLAYFNRASYFCELGRWVDALDDYDKAIELYPDFAKAYMNRSYVKNMLGRTKSSKQDYDTARKKVQDYRDKNASDAGSFADTTKKYSNLLALDADFAKKGFDNELLQDRDINIRLKPLYKFVMSDRKDNVNVALQNRYEHPLLDKFISDAPVMISITNSDTLSAKAPVGDMESSLFGDTYLSAGESNSMTDADRMFLRGLYSLRSKQYAAALEHFDQAVSATATGEYSEYYKAFYLLNRGVLVAEAGLHHGKQLLKFILRGRFIHAGEGLFHGIYNFLRIICFNSTAALQNLHFVILRTIIGYIVLFTVSLFKAHALPICSPASDAKWPQKQ